MTTFGHRPDDGLPLTTRDVHVPDVGLLTVHFQLAPAPIAAVRGIGLSSLSLGHCIFGLGLLGHCIFGLGLLGHCILGLGLLGRCIFGLGLLRRVFWLWAGTLFGLFAFGLPLACLLLRACLSPLESRNIFGSF